MHNIFHRQLLARQGEGRIVTIGLAGAGQMGTDIAVQCALMPGIRLGAISEIDGAAAARALDIAGHGTGRKADSAAAVTRAIEDGAVALTEDYGALCAADGIDVVIDATGNPNIGALIALEAIRCGKHVVMLNVEADICIGRHLKREADRAGVVYTGAAGDEPACTMELIGFARSLGLDVVAAGKGKNNPLDPDAVPDDYADEARARDMNARMLVEFVDGSKTMIEMVAIANATGLVPDVPGMHGPVATQDELASILCPREDGGVLHRKGVVDYSIGKGVAPGVFAVVEARHPRVAERLADLKVGPGPYFTLMRPYHLTSLETPLSAARAAILGEADMVPLDHPVAECVAVAKRDLKPGDVLGMIGERDYRGFAMTWADARAEGALPLGLAERARVTRPIARGERITRAACVADDELVITRIRAELDAADERFAVAEAAE